MLDESCGGDVDDEFVPEFGRQSRVKKTNEILFLHQIFFPCLVDRGCLPLDHSLVYPFSSQSFPSDRNAGRRDQDRERILVLRTFPVAVTTVVGFLDLRRVSISSEFKTFFAQHVH